MSKFTKPQVPRDAPGRADIAAVTRSEEELRISTVRLERQRARLTKFVEAETETRTIEVLHDQVRIEYEPISEPRGANQRAQRSEDGGEGWMVLYDEEVVMTTRRIPRERVRLKTHLITEQVEVREQLRKEHIEIQKPTTQVDGPKP